MAHRSRNGVVERNFWTRRGVLRGAGLGLAGLAGAALLGCGDEQESTGGSPRQSVRREPGLSEGPVPAVPAELDAGRQARRGGTLRMRYIDPPHLDINRTLSCTTYHPLSYSLSRLARARTGAAADPFLVTVEPDLAESWVANEDATEFTFRLRRGVQTHDKPPLYGREFLAEDVKLSWERYMASGTQRDVYAPIIDIATPDDYTVVARLGRPMVDFVASVAAWSYLWPRELIEDNDLLEREAIGTGPFIQERWDRGERMVFRRHPGYFEPGLPYVDEVVVIEENDRAAAQELFAAHGIFDVDALDDVELRALLDASPESALAFKFPRSRGANVNGWHFQMLNSAFREPRARRAISLAFDRRAYDQARNAGDNDHPDGPFSNSPMPWPYLFDAYPTAEANGEWYRFDPRQASELLRGLGYTRDEPLAFELVSHYFTESFTQQVIPGINESLPEVDIRYRELDESTYVEMLSSRAFESAIGIVWGPPGYAMDQWIYPWWHSNGGLNYNSVSDPTLDGLLDAQRAETDPLAQRELWRQVWDRVHDQVYDVWWPEAHIRGAQHNYVMNMRWHGLMGSYRCYASDQARAVWLDDGAPGGGPPPGAGRAYPDAPRGFS